MQEIEGSGKNIHLQDGGSTKPREGAFMPVVQISLVFLEGWQKVFGVKFSHFGGEFSAQVQYVIFHDSQLKGKLFWQCNTVVVRSVTFRTLDLSKLICRLEIFFNKVNSLRRLGMVVMGSERNSRMSSA